MSWNPIQQFLEARQYECQNYDSSIIRAINFCPANTIPSPVLPTPAAPRSVAELKSGLWSPEDMLSATWDKYKNAKTLQEAQMKSGGIYNTAIDEPLGGGQDYTDIILGIGAIVAGVVAVKAILR